MKVRVKFFAILRERAGAAEVFERNLRRLHGRRSLAANCKKIIPSSMCPAFVFYTPSIRIMSVSDYVLREQDEVVFIPPVSGG